MIPYRWSHKKKQEWVAGIPSRLSDDPGCFYVRPLLLCREETAFPHSCAPTIPLSLSVACTKNLTIDAFFSLPSLYILTFVAAYSTEDILPSSLFLVYSFLLYIDTSNVLNLSWVMNRYKSFKTLWAETPCSGAAGRIKKYRGLIYKLYCQTSDIELRWFTSWWQEHSIQLSS